MVRKDYKIREDQVASLKKLPGNASEHVRAALDDYIAKKQPKASKSPSLRREVIHG
jgi:Arc/MetJ-type ribon-helix-helix transcriptional regulator